MVGVCIKRDGGHMHCEGLFAHSKPFSTTTTTRVWILWNPQRSTHQIDAAPAAGGGKLSQVVVRHMERVEATEVIESVRESPEAIVGEVQLLKLLTTPANLYDVACGGGRKLGLEWGEGGEMGCGVPLPSLEWALGSSGSPGRVTKAL